VHDALVKPGAVTFGSGFNTFTGVVSGPPLFALLAAVSDSIELDSSSSSGMHDLRRPACMRRQVAPRGRVSFGEIKRRSVRHIV